MHQPLVSIICLCYNHERFVAEAINSVLNQTYKNIQIIVVDDASTDNSVSKIKSLANQNPLVQFLLLTKNVGNCKAFNLGLAQAAGEYIIDFATDDVMLSQKVEHQVNFFLKQNNDVGVVFTDAQYIDETGKYIRDHFQYLIDKKLISSIPRGDIYEFVLARYFISSPTMMIRRSVLDELGGYDETLSYEDFDFWVRSSRNFKYAFLDEKLMLVRKTSQSMSTGWYKQGDPQLHSTYLVCRKAKELNKTAAEDFSLVKRVRYELRQSVFSQNHVEAKLFYQLLKELSGARSFDKFVYTLGFFRLPLSFVRAIYHRIFFDSL